MQGPQKIQIRPIESEMRAAYIDYSMSVIVSRALPDVRDGLKPVQRRVLYAMSELGLASNRPTKKSARVVGEVLGKYHPHGDSAVYEAMVRMGQEWSLRYTLVEIQGNYGSIDGDGPAAMRYTEARLRATAEALLTDIDRNTVDFTNNFDDSLQEPTVLPAGIPNLLVNGASGIAVGMATNMAPHNLREVVAATVAYIDNRDIDLEGLMQYVQGPDFPTGGAMLGTAGIREALATGRGRIVVRGRANIEPYGEREGREAIIIDEIPYQVNKSELVARIGELASDQKIEGIAEVRDESDKNGMRIVVALKNGTIANVVLNNLYKHTALQMAFNVNNVCLVKGRPMVLNLKDLIRYYVEHRHEVVVRRTEYELAEARQRAHILEGLIIALDNLDEVIALIRASASPEEARAGLMSRFGLSEIQAKAILDMRLQRLTGLERDKIKEEYQQLLERIAYLERILAEEPLRMNIIKDELAEVARRYGDERRTRIDLAAGDLSMEDMIANEEMIVSISHQGYIKRTPATEYRVQNRGGMGARGTGTKDQDYVEHVFSAMAHDYLLLFTEQGRCFWLKVFETPEGSRQSKGRAIQNLLQIEPGDKVRTYLNIPKLREPSSWPGRSIIMCTEQGTVKKTELEAYSRPRTAGISAINITEGDKLLAAAVCQETSEIILASREGQAIRFSADEVRDMGRTATGVRGIRLEDVDGNCVVGMVVSDHPETDELLVVSEKGYGKRSALADYRKTGRGGKGVITLNVTPKTGKLVGIVNATNDEDLLISTSAGIVIRSRVDQIPTLGRNSQGVRLIKLQASDDIAAVTLLSREEVPDADAADVAISEEAPAEENGSIES